MPVRLSAPLAALSLDDVLAGKTCEPISLADFESFLLYKQRSIEYLRFVVWYQSYLARFLSLPLQLRSLSPPVSGAVAEDGSGRSAFKLPSPARLARFTSEAGLVGYAAPSYSTSGSPASHADRQPFRVECSSVAKTFLVPSTSPTSNLMTLSIPSTLLEACLAHLAETTHPTVFQPIYELAYETLQTSSLPFFLAEAEPNINHEKQLYWWLYGAFTFCLGWAVTVGCLFIEYDGVGEMRKRAWRLWAVPLLSLGGMQMYSAHRGFCSEVWGRGGTQLRPWELVAPSPGNEKRTITPCPHLEAARYPSTNLTNGGRQDLSQQGSETGGRANSIDITKIHLEDMPDFDLNAPGPIIIPSYSFSRSDKKPIPEPIITTTHPDDYPLPLTVEGVEAGKSPTTPSTPFTPFTPTSAHALLSSIPPISAQYEPQWSFFASQPSLRTVELSGRARIFGPERAVLDPRIRAIHRRVVRDILIFGFVWGVFWTVVILCLPWGR